MIISRTRRSARTLVGLTFVVAASIFSSGCTAFLAKHAMKDFPVEVGTADRLAATNEYQRDFVHLKALAEEVVPLIDRYFPPEKRAAMERKIFERLGEEGCSHETFVLSIRRYLAAFNNQHAFIAYQPKPIPLAGVYPLKIHYVSNDLFVVNVAREYDRALIGQRITAVNGQPISQIEEHMMSFVSAENLWARRNALTSFPVPFSSPGYYRLVGLADSSSNRLQLAFASHPAVTVEPRWKGRLDWHDTPPAHVITERKEHAYDCRVLADKGVAYLQFNACFDKVAVLDGLQTYVRPWLRPLVRAWLEVQFHREKPAPVLRGIYDPTRPVFAKYLASSISELHRNGITNLIIDLRRNGGGETELCNQLLYHLTHRDDLRAARDYQYNMELFKHYGPKEAKEFRAWYLKKHGAEPPSKQLLPAPEHERPFFAEITDPASAYYVPSNRPVFEGRVVVLANQNTMSAAAALAAVIRDNGLGVIVGTTTANHASGPTGMTPMRLPHSGITVSLPTEFVERADPANGEELLPDHWIENTIDDIRAGRDAAFEKALELLRGGAVTPASPSRAAP